MKYQSLRKVRGLPVEELSHTECQGLSERGGIHTGKCSNVGSQRKNRARSVFLGRESLVWDIRGQDGQSRCQSKWDGLLLAIRIQTRWGENLCRRTAQHELLEPKCAKQGFYARRWVAISGELESEQVEEGVDMDRRSSLRCCSSQSNTLDGKTEMGFVAELHCPSEKILVKKVFLCTELCYLGWGDMNKVKVYPLPSPMHPNL